jgi:hypothetical protein
MKSLLFVFALTLLAHAAQGQVFQFTREQMVEYTKANPFDRFSDGHPKVPDQLLKELEKVRAEDVWSVPNRHEHNNKFSGNWRILHPEKHLVGRAVTAQFMPLQEDVKAVARNYSSNMKNTRNNIWLIRGQMREGDKWKRIGL